MSLRSMASSLLTMVLLAAAFLAGWTQPLRADNVDDYLKAQMAARHIPGLSVAVVQDGKVVKSAGYGESDTTAKTPATADTVYEIGSLTKQVTAAAVLHLREQGKVDVDDSISRYLSGLPVSWKAITVRELLNQTSGLPNYRDALNLQTGEAAKNYSATQVIALANAKPLLFKPGTQFAYSNTNYHLLGMIVEKVSGKPYGDYLQQTFFGPLGMTQTRMNQPGSTVPHQAQGMLWVENALHVSPIVFSPSISFGDDGILSTVGDLVKWNAALDGDTLLNAGSKRLLWSPPVLPGEAAIKYASGWYTAEVNGHTLLWHNGLTFGGFTSAIFKFPQDKLTLIVLTNSLDIPGMKTSLLPYALTLGLAKLYVPDLAKKDAGIPDTDPQTAALVRIVSAQIASGTLDKSLFVPSFAAALTPAAVKPAHDIVAPLGPLTSLVLIQRNAKGEAFYRAVYGVTAVDWIIAVDKDHKISVLTPLPE